MAREEGELVDWYDDRGFGFIRRADGAGNIYVHITAIRRDGVRPQVGDRMRFSIAPGKGGRPSAVNVQIVKEAPAPTPDAPPRLARPKRTPMILSPRMWAAVTILALLAADISFGILPVWTALLYAIAGPGSFYLYGRDKQAAGKRVSRVPEIRLHLLDLCFGIVGGLLAQHVYRHKTSKAGYIVTTSLITALHVLVLGFILSDVFAPGRLGEALRNLSGS